VSFGEQVVSATSLAPALCVGLDPHPEVLQAWRCSDDGPGIAKWVGLIVEGLAEVKPRFVKPQVAFFERLGVLGMTALARLLGECRGLGICVIGDAKRGDIGSTMSGYAEAWLRPGADFEVDALTLVPYQGLGALMPALELSLSHGKGIFVLAATSNAEAWQLQSAQRSDGVSVAGGVIEELSRFREDNPGSLTSHGVVIGATVDHGELGVDLTNQPAMPILAPGYGAQGAKLNESRDHFPHSHHLLAASARGIIGGGPEDFPSRYELAMTQLQSA